MSAEQKKKPRAENDWTYEIAGLVAVVLVVLCGAWGAAHLGASFDDAPTPPGNPFSFAVALAKGDYAWPGSAASAVAAGEAVLLGILILAGYRLRQRAKKKPDVDSAAHHLAKGEQLGKLTMKGAAAIAERLGVMSRVPASSSAVRSRASSRSSAPSRTCTSTSGVRVRVRPRGAPSRRSSTARARSS